MYPQNFCGGVGSIFCESNIFMSMDFYLTTCLSFLIKLDMLHMAPLIDIVSYVIAWDKFKPVLNPRVFLGLMVCHVHLCARLELKALHAMVGRGRANFFKKEFRVTRYIIWKMNFSAGLSLFTNLVLKNLGSVFGCVILMLIHRFFSNLCGYFDFSAVTFWYYNTTHILTGKPLVGISPIGMEFMFSEYILGQYLTVIWCD